MRARALYNYHRWTSPPALQLADGLRDAYARSGLFVRVQSAVTNASDAVLSGRVSMFDEVDVTKSEWVGKLVLELQLEDARSSALWWSRTYRESEPLSRQSPEGLAVALSAALSRIVRASAPELARVMREHAAPAAGGGSPELR